MHVERCPNAQEIDTTLKIEVVMCYYYYYTTYLFFLIVLIFCVVVVCIIIIIISSSLLTSGEIGQSCHDSVEYGYNGSKANTLEKEKCVCRRNIQILTFFFGGVIK